MGSENLGPERQEELRATKSAEELERIAEKEGCELSIDMLDGAAGGSGTVCYRSILWEYCDGYYWNIENGIEGEPEWEGCRRHEKRIGYSI